MSVPKGKRKQSRFEAHHNFFKLRDEVTILMLMDFGFSEEKYNDRIEKYRQRHEHADNVDEVVAIFQKKNEAFNKWFIDKECEAVLQILRNIESEFTMGNSIYPSDTPAKLIEYIVRRNHINNAIGWCYALKQEIQYVIRTLPVDINKYVKFGEEIDKQISLYKGVRQADNRFLKGRKNSNDSLVKDAKTIAEILSNIIEKSTSLEIKE